MSVMIRILKTKTLQSSRSRSLTQFKVQTSDHRQSELASRSLVAWVSGPGRQVHVWVRVALRQLGLRRILIEFDDRGFHNSRVRSGKNVVLKNRTN